MIRTDGIVTACDPSLEQERKGELDEAWKPPFEEGKKRSREGYETSVMELFSGVKGIIGDVRASCAGS